MGLVDRTFRVHARGAMMRRLRTLATSMLIGATLLAVGSPASACTGNCDATCSVTVDQIIAMVNIAIGTAPISACRAGDTNGDGAVTIEEIVAAVGDAINDVVCQCSPRCGDEQVTGTEECDDGGTCIGGPNAGTHCTREGNCAGNGVCTGGAKLGTSCAADGDCPGATCQRCRPFGGDGCAANCTIEGEIPTTLVRGVTHQLGIREGTSGAVIHGDVLTIGVTIAGSETITAGHPRSDDKTLAIPYIIKAASVLLPTTPVGTLGCACVRAVELKTCGGTLFDADGGATATCTDNFLGQMNCEALGLPPCTAIHGPGNSATGLVNCGSSGLDGVDVQVTQDAGGESGIAGPVKISLNGHGPTGSALLLDSTAIGTRVGSCTQDYCGASDSPSERGMPATSFSTTGTTTAILTNANGRDSIDIVDTVTGERYSSQGSPASCSALLASPPSLSGYTTAGSYTLLLPPPVGDVVVTYSFVTQ